ncbi:hypothetical protein ABN028_19545 [Actinopolymorpha sp. B17G11]|uniref:hypothetical protein n=1 Tax=Actinopolymorpha sp. B17G11 TaxID=3160861 RepID=UPI0032E3999E
MTTRKTGRTPDPKRVEQTTARINSANARRCPSCGRGSALVWVADIHARVCRWDDCRHVVGKVRPDDA